MIFLAGKISANSEMKSGVSEFAIADKLALFHFLQLRVILFFGDEMMECPPLIRPLCLVMYGIHGNMA